MPVCLCDYSICLSVGLSVCPSVLVPVCLSVYSICLSVCPSVCLSVCPSVLVPVCLSDYSICLSVGLSACPSVLVPVCLSVYSIFVSVCPVCALTFESLDLETSFLVCGYFFGRSRKFRISRSSGQGQGHRSKRTGYMSIYSQVHL